MKLSVHASILFSVYLPVHGSSRDVFHQHARAGVKFWQSGNSSTARCSKPRATWRFARWYHAFLCDYYHTGRATA